eukprot:1534958-Rhodomonas_salina.1
MRGTEACTRCAVHSDPRGRRQRTHAPARSLLPPCVSGSGSGSGSVRVSLSLSLSLFLSLSVRWGGGGRGHVRLGTLCAGAEVLFRARAG